MPSAANRPAAAGEAGTCLAVFGGDRVCVEAVARRWAGPAATRALARGDGFVTLAHRDAGARVGVLLDPSAAPTLWPGGPVVWLVPERGPSQPELAQLRRVLTAHRGPPLALMILLCVPGSLSHAEAAEDLQSVAQTLRWGLDANQRVELQVVWLAGDGEPNLGSWLQELRSEGGG